VIDLETASKVCYPVLEQNKQLTGGGNACLDSTGPQGQPQHVNHSETSAANGVLRLVSDTAALRARFENTPKSLIQKLSGSLKIFDQSIWPSATPATINTIAVQNVGVIGSPSA
jgi:hypothetical protein